MSDTAAAVPEKTRPTVARGVHATWIYTLSSIVFFVVFIGAVLIVVGLTAFTRSNTIIDAVIVVFMFASLVLQTRYCWFLRVGIGGGLPYPAWTLSVAALPGIVWTLGLFSAELWQFTPLPLWVSTVLIACLVSRRARWLMVAAGIILFAMHAVSAHAILGGGAEIGGLSDGIQVYIYATMMPFAVIFSLWWWNIVVELDRHRRSAAELAIAKERLRFAADLHDIQGHHLQVIALKAELAERMLERDPVAAREQLQETRLVAAQALQETRSLVAGYREVGLDNELRNAREVLSAASATCVLKVDALPASVDARRALAFVVREATTNILRHSNASHVEIALQTENGCSSLTIVNDGVDAVPTSTEGTGLAGLRARVADRGGTLAIAMSDERFELIASIPDIASNDSFDHVEQPHG
ncbi:sensor histidine kinase [Paramicrobacterium fandaimingii]|uniref:sensor histidine kinase n=1 Tax=Paramicrobacterium fandaimingii TaxID=2708079 RepID=UPI00141F5667|nr:histidine kinase [Microbacterium fandaimingii]